jgi:hypothetical protein
MQQVFTLGLFLHRAFEEFGLVNQHDITNIFTALWV